MIATENIKTLEENQIFVFGSNEAGRHGKGAAKTALIWGAKYGQAEGLQGNTYAIPTKDKTIKRTLSVVEIKPYVDRFIQFANQNPHLIFLVTEIGCGLAGMTPKEIAPLFSEANKIDNVYLPSRFFNELNKNEEKFRVIIAGGRDFDNFRLLCKTCMHMLQNKTNVEIVSGCANGADKLGEKFAEFMGYPIKRFPANWNLHGKGAGHIRNKEMAIYGDALIAFWDEVSKGTEGMIEEAEKRNLKVKVQKYKIVKYD